MIITAVITDDLLKLLYREPDLDKESSDEVSNPSLMKNLRPRILQNLQKEFALTNRKSGFI